jgi:tetratricopeptide (TPR) repeat protein
MKLVEHFLQLSFWNKISVLGSAASIVGLVLYFVADSPKSTSIINQGPGNVVLTPSDNANSEVKEYNTEVVRATLKYWYDSKAISREYNSKVQDAINEAKHLYTEGDIEESVDAYEKGLQLLSKFGDHVKSLPTKNVDSDLLDYVSYVHAYNEKRTLFYTTIIERTREGTDLSPDEKRSLRLAAQYLLYLKIDKAKKLDRVRMKLVKRYGIELPLF